MVENIRTTQQEAQEAINEVVRTQQNNLETLQQVNEKVEKMKERSNEDKDDETLRKLAQVNCQKVIEDHAEKYQEGTRVFFFESVEKWLDDRSSPNRVMVISGNTGMGKSVIAAVICKRMQEVGRLSGSHFCQHDKARYRNPKVMLQSLAYMEFVHKQTQQGTRIAWFECSSEVACFDVSPQLDYLVCECRDGTIQLWSLHAGTQVWVRPVIVEKKFWGNTAAYRQSLSSPVISCYRSVVFLPKEDNVIVLPGVLSHAYTFDGDLKPLFPQSLCHFSVCSISGDKTTMLTDCLDDAKCIIMWSLKNGEEITRTTRDNDVLSFAWSLDGRLLAMSHSTGLISFVDVRDRFKTVAEHSLEHDQVCGMIKFSMNCQFLFCFRVGGRGVPKSFCLIFNLAEHPSITLGRDLSDLTSWELQSPSVAGFLLGDPPLSLDLVFDFVLVDSSAVLRGSPYRTVLDMLNINKLRGTDDKAKPFSPFRYLSHLPTSTLNKFHRMNRFSLGLQRGIAFSLTGEIIYVVTDKKATAWDVSSENCIGEVLMSLNSCLGACMKEGVLLSNGYGCLEMWNFELSNCIRRWPNSVQRKKIAQMIPISEERVVVSCDNKVIILNTKTSEIVSIPNYYGHVLTCNSKCQLLTCSNGSVQLLDGQTTLWKTSLFFPSEPAMFSLSGRVCCNLRVVYYVGN